PPTPTSPIDTLSLHDALPIYPVRGRSVLYRGTRLAGCRRREDREPENGRPRPSSSPRPARHRSLLFSRLQREQEVDHGQSQVPQDRKSTRLNSSHDQISYAVF